MPNRIGSTSRKLIQSYVTILKAEFTLHILSEQDSIRLHNNTAVIKMYFMFSIIAHIYGTLL